MKLSPRRPKLGRITTRPLPPPPLISSNLDELYEKWRRAGERALRKALTKNQTKKQGIAA
jgi:hypothetical protein